MPRCADPHGYWPAILTRIRSAADNAGTGSGLGALLLAMRRHVFSRTGTELSRQVLFPIYGPKDVDRGYDLGGENASGGLGRA